MTEPSELIRTATAARLMSASLSLGQSIDLWSLALIGVSLLGGVIGHPTPAAIACLLASVIAGVVQKFYALRVALDKRLFAHWAEDWSASTAATLSLETELALLDEALVTCGFLTAAPKGLRSLSSRVLGARALLLRQLMALAVQLSLVLVVLGVLWGEA